LALGINMAILYTAGAFVEQTWGRARFFVIYVLAGWSGNCLAVAYAPHAPLIGGLGALCGIFGAQGVWALLYGKYVPRRVARVRRSQVVVALLLLVLVSLLPNVSGNALLGGGLAGAAVALLLHFQRFGPPAVRWLVLVALVLIPLIGYSILDRARANNPQWRELVEPKEKREHQWDEREERQNKEQKKDRKEQDHDDFQNRFLSSKSPTAVGKTMREAEKAFKNDVADLLNRHPGLRAAAEVKKALAGLAEHREKLQKVAEALDKAGPYQEEIVENARQAGRDYSRGQSELFVQTERCLRAGNKWGRKDEDSRKEQAEKVAAARKRWEACLE
jgi:hypothetical protein